MFEQFSVIVSFLWNTSTSYLLFYCSTLRKKEYHNLIMTIAASKVKRSHSFVVLQVYHANVSTNQKTLNYCQPTESETEQVNGRQKVLLC